MSDHHSSSICSNCTARRRMEFFDEGDSKPKDPGAVAVERAVLVAGHSLEAASHSVQVLLAVASGRCTADQIVTLERVSCALQTLRSALIPTGSAIAEALSSPKRPSRQVLEAEPPRTPPVHSAVSSPRRHRDPPAAPVKTPVLSKAPAESGPCVACLLPLSERSIAGGAATAPIATFRFDCCGRHGHAECVNRMFSLRCTRQTCPSCHMPIEDEDRARLAATLRAQASSARQTTSVVLQRLNDL
jgi:hypothetical protein